MQTLGRLQGEIGVGGRAHRPRHGPHRPVRGPDRGHVPQGRLVEVGPVDDILNSPRHPYTRLLIDGLPKLTAKGKLVGIPGLPPALLNLPDGCSFNPRCPYAFDRCKVEIPGRARGRTEPAGRLSPVSRHRGPAARAELRGLDPDAPMEVSSAAMEGDRSTGPGRRGRRALAAARADRGRPPGRSRVRPGCRPPRPVRPRRTPPPKGPLIDGDAPPRAAQRREGLPERDPQDGGQHDRRPA